jgi:hypothetical protein
MVPGSYRAIHCGNCGSGMTDKLRVPSWLEKVIRACDEILTRAAQENPANAVLKDIVQPQDRKSESIAPFRTGSQEEQRLRLIDKSKEEDGYGNAFDR